MGAGEHACPCECARARVGGRAGGGGLKGTAAGERCTGASVYSYIAFFRVFQRLSPLSVCYSGRVNFIVTM